MFVARVAVGKQEDRSSDSAIVKPTDGFDSVYGSVAAAHMAYIVYDLRKSYPAYLVTYQKS